MLSFWQRDRKNNCNYEDFLNISLPVLINRSRTGYNTVSIGTEYPTQHKSQQIDQAFIRSEVNV